MFTPTLNCVESAVTTEVKYGLLYNWYAATDARNICADGWEVPTQANYATLGTFLGGNIGAGIKLKEIGLTYWTTPNAGSTNEVGFNGRGAGNRNFDDGIFYRLQEHGTYYTVTPQLGSNAYHIDLVYNSDDILPFYINKKAGLSLRLIKTTTTLTHGQTGTYTGNDGKVYRTICIGTQEWLADNLCETKYRNGDLIPEVTDNTAWAALTTGALCAYDNDWDNAYTETSEIQSYAWVVNGVIKSTSPDPFVTTELLNNDKVYFFFIANENPYFSNVITVVEKTEGCPDLVKYGLLYNWWAATDEKNITSAAEWIVPTNAIRSELLIGGADVRGGNLKETGTDYWDSPNTGAVNIVGFNARGSGLRDALGVFGGLKRETRIWTSNNVSIFNNGLVLFYNSANSFINTFTEETSKRQGNVIRICRPATASEQLLADGTACEPYTGNDGKIYRTVKIGTQVWTADNLAETKFRNGDWIPGFDGGVYTPITNEAWAALTTSALCVYDNDWDNV
jgi:uncharacterized protein (TIGR02145 family)